MADGTKVLTFAQLDARLTALEGMVEKVRVESHNDSLNLIEEIQSIITKQAEQDARLTALEQAFAPPSDESTLGLSEFIPHSEQEPS